MNWNGTYWGLVRHIGPWAGTTEDERRANSRAGGPHAGHGNWMQTFNPSRNGDGDARVYDPERGYHYRGGDPDIVVKFDVLGDRIANVPGSRIGRGAKKVAGKRGFTDVERFTNNVTTRTELGRDMHYERNTSFPNRNVYMDKGDQIPVHLRDFDLGGNDRRGSVKPDLNLEPGRRESMFEERLPNAYGAPDVLATEAEHVVGAVERKIAKLRKHAKAHSTFLVHPGGRVKRRVNEPPSSVNKKVKTPGAASPIIGKKRETESDSVGPNKVADTKKTFAPTKVHGMKNANLMELD